MAHGLRSERSAERSGAFVLAAGHACAVLDANSQQPAVVKCRCNQSTVLSGLFVDAEHMVDVQKTIY